MRAGEDWGSEHGLGGLYPSQPPLTKGRKKTSVSSLIPLLCKEGIGEVEKVPVQFNNLVNR